MKIAAIIMIAIGIACNESSKKGSSIQLIAESGKQDSIFYNLVQLTNNSIPEVTLQDSLAFLFLPIEASCPSCRNKTIDSIVKHQDRLIPNHYIILSANGGRKTINSYFKEQKSSLPTIENRLFLDSTNESYKHDLCSDKPTIYYTHNKKAYKKVAAIPSTVREDLREFFSGHRNSNLK